MPKYGVKGRNYATGEMETHTYNADSEDFAYKAAWADQLIVYSISLIPDMPPKKRRSLISAFRFKIISLMFMIAAMFREVQQKFLKDP